MVDEADRNRIVQLLEEVRDNQQMQLERQAEAFALQISVRAGADSDPDGAEGQPARTMARAADRTEMFLIGDLLVMVEKR